MENETLTKKAEIFDLITKRESLQAEILHLNKLVEQKLTALNDFLNSTKENLPS